LLALIRYGKPVKVTYRGWPAAKELFRRALANAACSSISTCPARRVFTVSTIGAKLTESPGACSPFDGEASAGPATLCLRLATYPANLCPLLFGGEFAKFGSDFGEAVG
jgi:hypothetical protein